MLESNNNMFTKNEKYKDNEKIKTVEEKNSLEKHKIIELPKSAEKVTIDITTEGNKVKEVKIDGKKLIKRNFTITELKSII